MNIILDTHYALWCLYDAEKISGKAYDIIADPNNDIYVSSASIIEISNKHIKKPEKMTISGEEFYHNCLENDFYILPVQAKIIHEYEDLKLKSDAYVNKDPFDRILLAQAKHYKYMLLTHDHCIEYYNEPYTIII